MPSRRIGRWLLAAALTMPLLQNGACVDIAQRSLINGFFDWFNAALIERLDPPIDARAGGP